MAGCFEIQEHTQVDKSFLIRVRGMDFELQVDYDDVDHAGQDILANKVVAILNDHWDDDAYQSFDEEYMRHWEDAEAEFEG
jgi:hypothetical protein